MQKQNDRSDWIDIHISTTIDAGELLAALGDPDVQGAWQDDTSIHLYWPHRLWSPEHLARLRQTLRTLVVTERLMPDIAIESLPDQDWNRVWAQSIKPLRIGKRILIRPSWETVAPHPDQVEIILDPRQAFGTGHHATTRMLLERLEDIIHGGESVLDVGTGSALLAMVAIRLGASRAVGVDHDPVAIACARDYAALNGFGEELTVQCGTLSHEHVCDVVLANLDRQTVMNLAGPLAAATGKRLLLSGLLPEQREEIVQTFARMDLYESLHREQEGWLAIEFLRAQSCEGGE